MLQNHILFSYWCYSYIRWSFTFQNESFRKNIKTDNEIADKIRDEKVQYNLNREAAKVLALTSGKIDKYNISQVKRYCFLIKDK